MTWKEGGKLEVTFRSHGYQVDGEVVDDTMSTRDASSGLGVKTSDATCLWNEIGSTTTLTRGR